MPKRSNPFGEKERSMGDLFKDKRKKKERELQKIEYLERKMDQLPQQDLKSEINRLSKQSTTGELNKYQLYRLKAAKKALFNAKSNPKHYQFIQNRKQREEDSIITFTKKDLEDDNENQEEQKYNEQNDSEQPPIKHSHTIDEVQGNVKHLNYTQREKVRELDPLLNPEIDYKVEPQKKLKEQFTSIIKVDTPLPIIPANISRVGSNGLTNLIGNYESDNEEESNEIKADNKKQSINEHKSTKESSILEDFYKEIKMI